MAQSSRQAVQDRIDAIRERSPVADRPPPPPAPVQPNRTPDLEAAAALIASILPIADVETWEQQMDGSWRCRETRERRA